MVTTTSEILTINGTVMNTLARNVSSLTGRLRVPGRRTKNLDVPGKHGKLYVPNKKFQAGMVTLPIWVAGCNDDGDIPGGSTARREFYKRVDELVTLFGVGTLLDIRHTLPDGSIRQTFGEVLDMFDFTTDAAPTGKVTVVLELPDTFWQDVNTTTQSLVGTGATLNPTNFAGGSAPIEDMVYDFLGPWTNPGVTFADGSFFQYSAALAAGNVLKVDSGQWELTRTGGPAADYGVFTHDGGDAVWGAFPANAGILTMRGTARTTSSSLTLTGRRKYLVG
jgi:hypothetical protein